MKHSNPTELSPTAVIDAVSVVGVSLSREQAEAIVKHAALVVDTNRRMNLTRLTAPEDVLALHIVDSLAFLPHVAPLEGPVIDIGSGAGYPGIPLAILGYNVTLCESVKKKAAFLVDASRELGLAANVQALRAEELAGFNPGRADVVIARAVSATASLLELASPLLRLGGRLIALKGVPGDDELASAAAVAPLCGMREAARVAYALPTGEQRTVLVFEKAGSARMRLPRHPGAAQRQPLG